MSGYWKGADKMRQQLVMARERKTAGARTGILMALLNVLGVSNSQVPHEDGDLERDGAASVADGDELRGAVSYGRNADTKDYAERQHEDMTLKHDAGRNAKFLENAFNSTRDTSREIIAAQIKRSVEK